MALDLPAALGGCRLYLDRADEFEERDPRMSYFLRQFVVHRGISILRSSAASGSPQDTSAIKKFLGDLMNQLESEKSALEEAGIFPKDKAAEAAYVKGFAMRLFSRADDLDRAPSTTLSVYANVIKLFVAAACCFEACELFEDVMPEVADRIRYAKFRATAIHKALQQNQTPAKPDDISAAAEISAPVPDPVVSQPTTTTTPPITTTTTTTITAAPTAWQPVMQATRHNATLVGTPMAPLPTAAADRQSFQSAPVAVVVQAQKLCKEAAAALQFDDVRTAIASLRKALHTLQPYE